MIYTCTLNPAIDYHVHSDTFNIGTLNRSQSSKMSVGGKGINVSIVLKNLGVDSIATGFLGGFTGKYIEDYLHEELHLSTRFVQVNELSRINIKLTTRGIETELNQEGPTVNQEVQDEFIRIISELSENDIFVCGGAKPQGANDIYKRIASLCQKKHIPFVVDTSKQDLLDILAFHPLLVKPNIHELEEIFGVNISSLKDIIYYGTVLLNQGAQFVIVSRGRKGSVFISKNHVYVSKEIEGSIKNTIGAGDSMVAGFVSEYSKSKNEYESYKIAIACGSATAFSETLATNEDVVSLLDKVIIKEGTSNEND